MPLGFSNALVETSRGAAKRVSSAGCHSVKNCLRSCLVSARYYVSCTCYLQHPEPRIPPLACAHCSRVWAFLPHSVCAAHTIANGSRKRSALVEPTASLTHVLLNKPWLPQEPRQKEHPMSAPQCLRSTPQRPLDPHYGPDPENRFRNEARKLRMN